MAEATGTAMLVGHCDWVLDDPHGQGIDAVRPIRDEIERRVRTLLAELGVSTSS